jgi:alpha-tubulin suppressor-like RCC1 family protein
MRGERRSWLVILAVGIFAALGCGEQQPAADGDVEAATVSRGLATVKVPQAVTAGAYHSLFLRKDGTVWAWGQNVAGQLGTGSTSSTPQPQPSQVTGLPATKALAAGVAHSLALDVSGNVWAWGQNASGQSGLGSAGGTVLVPTRVTALSSIQAIAANGNFSLALGEDGRLWAWGQNTSGQIGTGGTSASVPTPVVVPGLPTLRSMAAGVNHVLALDADGRVWGWGLNTSAQVGTRVTSSTVLTPVQVAGLPRAKAIAAGAGHSLIVDEQFGNVWAWGQNTFGQVGTGTATSTPMTTPTPVNGVFAVTALIAGHNSSLVIVGNGLAMAWGHNASGQLGNGTTANSASPVNVTGLSDTTTLAAGAQHALALRPGCPVWAWGNNGQGQLGTGSTSSAPVTTPGATLLTNTFYFDGDMDGFGDEYITEQACTPSPGFVEEVDCDDYTATTHPGALEQCNGMDDNCDGAVDDGNPSGGEDCATGQPGVCAAGMTACANGSVVCQQRQAASTEQCDGLDNDCNGASDEGNPGGRQACDTGELGVCGEGVTYCTHGAIECVPMRGASPEVCDSLDNDCDGQPDDGLAFQAWYRDQDGDNYGLTSQSVQSCAQPSGHAPNAGDCNDAQPSLNPGATEVCDAVDNNCNGVTDEAACAPPRLAAGNAHTVALRADGTVWAWGRNDVGQLGDGTTTQRSTPVRVPALTSVTALAAGGAHSVALRQDGTIWAWGYNDAGQLGDGTTTNRSMPVQVHGLTGVTALAAGQYHTVALRQDGTVWAWGANLYGELGDGTTTPRSAPMQVQGLTGITALAAGQYHTVALRQGGTVWAWGFNFGGQLGDGTTTQRSTPVQVQGLTGVTALSAGAHHTVALRQGGTFWAWGFNGWGQLGDGSATDRSTPVQVPALTGVTAIAAGYGDTYALRQDGTVWAWGRNATGQLGDGTTTQRSTPGQVPGLTSVTAMAAGSGHTFASRQDGTVWAWGDNDSGKLGDGTTTHRLTPVQVQGLGN